MKRCLVFLDIDGVLNDHTPFGNGYCGIQPGPVRQLNRILFATEASIVITSAWRYLIRRSFLHRGSMTIKGFEYLLMTHGVDCHKRIYGRTRPDTMVRGLKSGRKVPLPNERGKQIARLVTPLMRYVVLDDLDLGITEACHPFVQTDSKVGLTEVDADRAIEILNAR